MIKKQTLLPVIGLLCCLWGSVNSAISAELIMFREQGCPWCEKWDEEIKSIYPKTAEGKIAPLKEVSIHDPIEEYISKKGLVHYTPTFVLVENKKEIGRITGYPGEDNFWWLLEQLVSKLDKSK